MKQQQVIATTKDGLDSIISYQKMRRPQQQPPAAAFKGAATARLLLLVVLLAPAVGPVRGFLLPGYV